MKTKGKFVGVKWFCIALFMTILSACMVVFAGCKEDEKPKEGKITITLNKSALTLAEWENATLTAETSGTSEAVTWASADTAIASVDGGTIYALSVGETTITASVGDVSASCKVVVTATEAEPTIIVNEIDKNENSLVIKDSGSFNLNASVLWNAEAIDGATISWTSKDESVAVVTGNGYSATISGIKEGNTAVQVFAQARGKTAVYEFNVRVNPESALLKTSDSAYKPYAGGYKVAVKATEETTGDKANVLEPKFYAQYKGQVIENPEIVWSTEDTDCIEVDSATGKITAKKAGSATITGVWHYEVTNKDYSITLSVAVERVNVSIAGVKEVIVNRDSTAVSLTLSDESVQSLQVGDKEYSDGFIVSGDTLTLSNDKFGGINQRENVSVQVVTNKRVYSLQVKASYAIATLGEWQGIWNTTDAPIIFSQASVITIEADLDVSSYDSGNILYDGYASFSGIFDGQGHTINGAKNGWRGLFNSLGEDGVVKNVAFTNIRLTKEPKIFANSVNGTVENCYFEGATIRTDSDPTPAFCKELGRSAEIRNVFIYVHGSLTNQAGQKAVFNSFGSGSDTPALVGVYAVVDYGDGIASNEEAANTAIALYSTISEFKAAVKELPSGYSSDIWQIYEGMLSFKTSETQIAMYLANNALTLGKIPAVEKETAITLSASKACTWSVEGLDASMYTLENGVLTLSASATVGETFTLVGSYTETKYGYTYTQKIENIEIKKKPASIKALSETPLVGSNRTSATYSFTLDNEDMVIGVSVNNASVDSTNYALSGNILTIKAAAFTTAGEASIKIETDAIIYTTIAEVVDYAIGTADEFDAVWNKDNWKTVAEGNKIIKLTADFTAKSIGAANTAETFNGTFDGAGHTITAANAWWTGLFSNLGAAGVIKNVAFKGIVYRNNTAYVIGNKLEGTIENCYFEGTVYNDKGSPALANQIAKSATIKNVVIVLHKTSAATTTFNGVYNSLMNGSANPPTVSGLYVINEVSNGNQAGTYGADLNGAVLYSSITDFLAAYTTRPDDISEGYWAYLQALQAS